MPKPRTSVKAGKSTSGQKHTNLNVENVQPVFANWAQVGATGNEFRLTFGEVLRSAPQELITREMARVYMTPRVAKALLGILSEGVQKHEKAHGEIDPRDVSGD